MPSFIKEQLNDLQPRSQGFNFFKDHFHDYWNGGIAETIPFIHFMEEQRNYTVELIAPGLKKDDFNIEVGRNLVTLSCETESFYRSFIIPDDADISGIVARYTNGVLNLSIPKKNQIQKNKIHKIIVE